MIHSITMPQSGEKVIHIVNTTIFTGKNCFVIQLYWLNHPLISIYLKLKTEKIIIVVSFAGEPPKLNKNALVRVLRRAKRNFFFVHLESAFDLCRREIFYYAAVVQKKPIKYLLEKYREWQYTILKDSFCSRSLGIILIISEIITKILFMPDGKILYKANCFIIRTKKLPGILRIINFVRIEQICVFLHLRTQIKIE